MGLRILDLLPPDADLSQIQAEALLATGETVRELVEALEELMKAGEHEGPCDNEGSEYEECCSIHVATAAARRESGRAAIKKARGEK